MYDVLIIGAGPGGIFTAYELMERRPDLKVAVFETGHPLNRRKCPIDGEKVKSCIHCKCCSIMSGFGGAGAFSDGKYNITNDRRHKPEKDVYAARSAPTGRFRSPPRNGH